MLPERAVIHIILTIRPIKIAREEAFYDLIAGCFVHKDKKRPF